MMSKADVVVRKLLELGYSPKVTHNGWMSCCPAHEDRTPSLSISKGDDGRALVCCHKGCTAESVCSAIGLTVADLMPESKKQAKSSKANSNGKIVATYDYVDEKGELVFQVQRFEPKTFKQRRPDGKGGWINRTSDLPDDRKQLLYRLPKVLSSSLDECIFVVEGEKDVHSVEELRLVATCNAGGASEKKNAKSKSKWKPGHAKSLVGKKVAILPDNDDTGRSHANDVANSLKKIASKVKIINLPGLPQKGDVTDWIRAGGTREQLLELVEKTDDFSFVENSENPEPALLEKLPISDCDPYRAALDMIDSHKHESASRLIFWNGGFLYWSRGRFNHIPNTEARSMVVRSLNKLYKGVGCSVVSNVLEQVRAASMVSVLHQPPCWLIDNQWMPEHCITTENSIVHLPTYIRGVGEFSVPATPNFFSTSSIDYEFQLENPGCETWLSFLHQLWPDDPDSITTLQEWFGYCLTPDTRQQKILLMLGQKRSGKGTICRVLRSVIGEGNVAGPTLSSLQTNFGLWPLLGKTVAIISDARLSGRSDQAVITERLLAISGEDAQTVDRKNMEPVTTKLSVRFMVVTNELPRLQDSSGALSGRMIVLRLTESFYGREDKSLTDKLIQERLGILHWAIEGWRRLNERGEFHQPESGDDLARQMNELSSPITAFVDDRCEVGSEYSEEVKKVFEAWREWCSEMGREPGTSQTMGRDLTALLPRLRTRQIRLGAHRMRQYDGIRLKSTH